MAIAMQSQGRAVTSGRDYQNFATEGYQKNAIAFAAVSGISEGVGALTWRLYKKGRGNSPPIEILESPLLDLLARPNPMQSRAAFFESLAAYLKLAGNSYVEKNVLAGNEAPSELWPLRPDRMSILPGATGIPAEYIYKVGSKAVRYPVDVSGKSPVLHMKTFNPVNDWYGMSPIEAAAMQVDSLNESVLWNLALIQNGARPSGALVMQAQPNNPAAKMSEEQKSKLKEMLNQRFTGGTGAGNWMLLDGGLDWKEMGFSPKDMDWLGGQNTSARHIALAFKYPPILLGVPGDSTYNNYQEARLALYEDAILPTANHITDALNVWLCPLFGDGLYLEIDLDVIDALSSKREATWKRVNDSNFLTANEKREAVGYDPIAGGDELLVNASLIPATSVSDTSSEEVNVDDADEDMTPTEDDDTEGASDNRTLQTKVTETQFEQFVREYAETYAGNKIQNLSNVTRKKVIKAVRDAQVAFLAEGSNIDQLADAIRANVGALYQDFSKSRALTIARTETSIAANAGSREAAKALQIPNLQKEWVSADDDRVRDFGDGDATDHQVMNGVTEALEKKFSVPSLDGDDQMDGPGDPTAPPDQVINCRCVLVYNTPEKAINLSATGKRRHWLTQVRKRNTFERKFKVQLAAVFKREGEEMLSGLDGINDAQQAETIVGLVLDQTKAAMKTVYKANLISIMDAFGKDVLKIKT